MKRSVKNTINIAIILVIIGGMVGVTYVAKNNLNTTTTNDNQFMMGERPEMLDGEMPTPPDMQDDSTAEEKGKFGNNEMPGNHDRNTKKFDGEEPPAKPDGDEGNMTPPDMSDGEMPTPPDMNGEFGDMMTPNTEDAFTQLTTPYIIAYIGLSLLLSMSVIYLFMSGFNAKTFKETFKTNDKKLIYILSLLLLTATASAGSIYVVNEKVLSNNTNMVENQNSNDKLNYQAVTTINENDNITSGKYSSNTADENAIMVSGNIDVSLSNIDVTKSGDSDGGDESSFYGNNSAILAKDGANLNITNATISTTAKGANGVFSYGGSATTNNSSSDGTTVNISDSKITTTGDNAGGIMTTGGGITNASNLTIETSGTSSAAIRSDRGGGEVNVDGGTYTTSGTGSPSIYSTANIKVSNATLISKASEGIVVEGANSVSINNTVLTDSNTKLNGQSTTYKNIFLYQSMSGDASSGTASFTAKNSTITTNNGDTLYVTNTTATINLENNKIINNDSNGNFLRAKADSWGKDGSNGGNVILNMTNQTANGNIVIDSVSTLVMNMNNNSSYTGTINSSNEAKSIKLTLSKNSKIKLTGNSYVTSLEDADSTYSNIDFNGYKLYVNGVAIN